MMRLILLIDFGSTYTKLTAVDIDQEIVVATAKAPTTVTTHIMEGLNAGLKLLEEKLNGKDYEFVEKIASSSAAGGLRMDAIGLVPKLTAEAAKMAVLNAGAKLVGCYSYELMPEDIDKIAAEKSDIILLAGGTDGGNKDVIMHNAKVLAESSITAPVVIAGNRNCSKEIALIFKEAGKEVIITENVLPSVNNPNIEPVRQQIRNIFISRIIHAKGIDEASVYLDKIMMPTPTAVLYAAQLLAKGTEKEPGIGDLMLLDIGGATTDVYSMSEGIPSKAGMIPKGLPEPYAKRTVEGDLGVRYNAKSIIEEVGLEQFAENIDIEPDVIANWIDKVVHSPETLAKTPEEKKIDIQLAYQAARISSERHVGYTETHYTPMGVVYAVRGKDLSLVQNVIGTGGPLVNSQSPAEILKAVVFNPSEPEMLRPQEPKFYLDSSYIFYAAGLMSEDRPELALRIMKKYLQRII